MFNPNANIARGKGIDLPILTVYLAGRICGEHIDLCLGWRREIINHYRNYKIENNIPVAFPISFLDPLNSGEAESVDKVFIVGHSMDNFDVR